SDDRPRCLRVSLEGPCCREEGCLRSELRERLQDSPDGDPGAVLIGALVPQVPRGGVDGQELTNPLDKPVYRVRVFGALLIIHDYRDSQALSAGPEKLRWVSSVAHHIPQRSSHLQSAPRVMRLAGIRRLFGGYLFERHRGIEAFSLVIPLAQVEYHESQDYHGAEQF